MFLPAKFIQTYKDRDYALALLAELENTEIQDIDEVDETSDFLVLNAKHYCEGVAVPLLFILVTTSEGEQVFSASGNHLSSSAARAKVAIADELLPSLVEGEIDAPAVVCVFEFTFGGSYVLH